MLHRSSFACLMVALLCPLTGAFGDATIVQDGQAKAVIYASADVMAPEDRPVTPANFAASETEYQRRRLRESVKDLAACIEKISGARIEIITSAGPPKGGDPRVPILVGDVASQAFGPVGGTSMYKQFFRVVVSPKGVGLEGESNLATGYAIYELLDRLGCRWFIPSDMGECLPQMKTITLKEMDLKKAPATITRAMPYPDQFNAFCRRNRMGGFPYGAGQVLEYDGDPGGSGYLPKAEIAAHPEWQAQYADGRPMPGRFKWSSPTLADALAARINERLDKNPMPCMSLSPIDGAIFDESPADRAMDAGDIEPTLCTASLTDRLITFCNRITEKVVAKHPDEIMAVLAYVQFTRPPLHAKPNPNLIVQISPITYNRAQPMSDDAVPQSKELREIIARWGKLCRFTGYYAFAYHLAETTAPCPQIQRWSNDVPYVLANNCKIWAPENLPTFETNMPNMYLGTRLAFDSGLKPADIIKDLNSKFYGHAAPEMTAYWSFIDDAWVKTPEYSGCGFGYMHRFPPATMKKARELMNAGIAAASTPQEKFRVQLANDSLTLFELFMQMRYDLAEGRFAGLKAEMDSYYTQVVALGEKYKDQFCFGKVPWAPRTYNGNLMDAMYKATYEDAARIARDCVVVGPPTIRQFKYLYEKETPKSTDTRCAKPDFNDKAWKTTDIAADTWSTLGHTYEQGSIWYRTSVDISAAAVPAGKKVYLWVSNTDGSARVFINGTPVKCVKVTVQPDKTTKTELIDAPDGYCQPFSFDITAAIKPGGSNQITILGTRTSMMNELGTGGLLGPVALYREK